MTRNLVCHIHILNPRDAFNRSQSSDRVTGCRRPKEVPENPIVSREPIDESTSDDASNFEPRLFVGGDGAAKEINVLDNAKCLASCEFGEGVEDGSGTQRKPDERDGTHADVAMDKGVSEYKTCGFGSIQSVGPRTIRERRQERE